MPAPVLVVHGPPTAAVPLVLDSPHSGLAMPADFGAVCSEAELREGEDSFIDELYQPAAARGVPLLAALFPRTYLDVNRHAGDVDPELLMGPNTSVAIEGVDGQPRADIVLGDRDGTTCAPEFTAFVRDTLAGHGYSVQVNQPFKGVELVRAWSDPARGRHSLQLEVNKRLYMDTATLRKHAGFGRLQAHLMNLLDGILAQFGPGAPASRPPPATPAP